jgi:hypothetical protein
MRRGPPQTSCCCSPVFPSSFARLNRPYPSLKLFIPAMTTRIVGTLIAVYGLFMEPVGWEYVIYIYIYATVWFVFNDFLKVTVYRMLHKTKWLLGREHAHESLD